MRLNTRLRNLGYASRREADALIKAGKVFVNGVRAVIGLQVEDSDTVEVRGNDKVYRYFAYYKPRGLATQGETGEPSVIREERGRGLFPIGRLDKESEGLLILTNDGRATTASVGDNRMEKEYLITVQEPLKKNIILVFERGMLSSALGQLLPARIHIAGPRSARVILREGKRHQLRVMFSELGYTVTALKRTKFGPVTLSGLQPGERKALTPAEVSAFQGTQPTRGVPRRASSSQTSSPRPYRRTAS